MSVKACFENECISYLMQNPDLISYITGNIAHKCCILSNKVAALNELPWLDQSVLKGHTLLSGLIIDIFGQTWQWQVLTNWLCAAAINSLKSQGSCQSIYFANFSEWVITQPIFKYIVLKASW